MGQGQPRVIILTTLVVLTQTMLHTKFQGHRSIGSGEEDFLKVFTIYGHGSHLGHVTRTILTTFRSPNPWNIIWNLVTIGPVVSEKSFEIVDRRPRTTEPAYTISSLGAFGSGELKSTHSLLGWKWEFSCCQMAKPGLELTTFRRLFAS